MAGDLGFLARARRFASRVAVVDRGGERSFAELIDDSSQLAHALLRDRGDLAEDRVAFLISPGYAWVVTQWAIWRAGGIAVPLSMSHPLPELEYVIDDCEPIALIAEPETRDRLQPIAAARGLRLIESGAFSGTSHSDLPRVASDRAAMIVYTSGTTGGPKGVVTTHANIAAQVESLISAWAWRESDHILSVLPLHHVHGIVNVVACSLWAGARCEILERFDPVETWNRFVAASPTLFMAVPTIYAKLLSAWDAAPDHQRRVWSAACRSLRLMVSGSAALPTGLFERWRRITGHTLLERYGMTEIGMALSNPLDGERRPGHVGRSLPGVEVRRVDETGAVVADEVPGEIEVRGPGVFGGYWQRDKETEVSFRGDWFRTGDVAVIDEGSYRILGRQSVDIIKSGGFKISAIEIEETLREHPAIRDAAVVGVPDEEWGERVGAAVVLAPGEHLSLEALRGWVKERLATYKAPSLMLCLEELPRNPMGKVVKPALRNRFVAL